MSTNPHPAPRALSDEEVQCRHERIRRGLARANAVTAIAFLIAIGLALIAVFYALQAHRHARSAQAATRRATEELWHSQLAEARALRWSGKGGRRSEGLQAIQTAVRIRPSPELRDEAIATLPLVDVQPGTFWQALPSEDTVLAISFQQGLYAVGHVNGQVNIRHMTNHTEVGTLALSNRVMCLEFSSNGQWLVAHSINGSLQIWDAVRRTTNQQLHLPAGEFNEHSLIFTPDSQQVAVCSPEGIVRVFDLSTGREGEPFAVQAAAAACFDATGRWLAVGAENQIQIWEVATRQLQQTLEVGERVNDLAWHPATRQFAVATRSGRVVLLSPRGKNLLSLTGHTALVSRVLFDRSGQVLISTSWDGTTRFWSAHSGCPLLVSQAGFARQFDPSGQRLFYSKEGMGFGDWQFTSGTSFRTLALPRDDGIAVQSVDFSPDDRWLAVAALDGVHLWDCRSKQPLGTVRLPAAGGAAFADDGESLVVRSAAGLYHVPCRLDPMRGLIGWGESVLLAKLPSPLFEQAFATRGIRHWFVAGNASNVAIVDLARPTEARCLELAGDGSSMGISPDGSALVTSYWKGRGTHMWPLDRPASALKLGDEGGLAVFSPDGRCLVVGTAKQYLFYDTTDWRLQREIPRDAASALSGVAAFHPDGHTMAVTHTLRQIRLLETATGRTMATLDAPTPERITALCFSRNGTMLAAATGNAEVHLWDLAELRRELQGLGLDLNAAGALTGNSTGSPILPFAAGYGWALGLSGLGAGLALIFAFYSMRHHRRLIAAYAEVEAIAAEHRRELKSAQSQLLHSEKMKALGTLAAGIAHDFNNLLSIIRMAGQLVEREIQPTGQLKHNLQDIEQAAVQGKNLVRSILGYSREPGDLHQPYNVNAVVGETLAMLSKQFLSGIVLTLELAPETPAVRGDKSRLEQILLNLIVNASEAMHGTGKLTLIVRPRCDGRARILPPCPAAEYVELIVRDYGPGIAPEVLPRVFEPFFTTKQSGAEHGTGLGLTTVYSIARQDGLGLDVETAAGQGTSFRVLLPMGNSPGTKA